MSRRPARRTGFTLIEVLVVVGVIALLVATLLPSLRSVRDQSRRLVCKNNIRSIWTGVLTYVMEFDDRLPLMTNINAVDPNANPFDPAYPTTVGRVLRRHVVDESWVCPSAVRGYPLNAGEQGWTMTYEFQTLPQTPPTNDPFNNPAYYQYGYDAHQAAYQWNALDPAFRNYAVFDGRPYRLLDGRRYVSSRYVGVRNDKGNWNTRFPILYETFIPDVEDPSIRLQDNPASIRPLYPHRGQLQERTDLGRNVRTWEELTGAKVGPKTGEHELHADGRPERMEIYFTRYWVQHR